MTHSHTKLTGLMTLTLLDADGNAISTHQHHNNVTASGQNMLLEMMQGKLSMKEFIPILGNKEFDINSDKPDSHAGAIRLTTGDIVSQGVKDNVLSISFRGDAHRKDSVVGGGLIFVTDDGKKRLYNFAPTKTPIDVVRGMPVLLNFNISVGN